MPRSRSPSSSRNKSKSNHRRSRSKSQQRTHKYSSGSHRSPDRSYHQSNSSSKSSSSRQRESSSQHRNHRRSSRSPYHRSTYERRHNRRTSSSSSTSSRSSSTSSSSRSNRSRRNTSDSRESSKCSSSHRSDRRQRKRDEQKISLASVPEPPTTTFKSAMEYLDAPIMPETLETIDNDNGFTPAQFTSSSTAKKIPDKVLINLESQTISVTHVRAAVGADEANEDPIFHKNLFTDESVKMERWIRKFINYRQKMFAP